MKSLLETGTVVREASRELALASATQKNDALLAAADCLLVATDELLSANKADVESAHDADIGVGTSSAALDRLQLTGKRIDAMVESINQVAVLADPVGEIASGWVRPNGLRISHVRVPLGVVGVIYENRPNVTSDSAALCLKSGNAAFLRGSSSSIGSNRVIARALQDGLYKAGLPRESVTLVDDVSRESAVEFMKLRGIIDCLIPRGGPGLINSVREHATVPYVIDGDGNCHVYVDEHADLDMAVAIVVNAKTQRPSVCNSAESLIVHDKIADVVLPRIRSAMPSVELVGDRRACEILGDIVAATDQDFASEYLGLKMSVAVVPDLSAAIAHISRYSTGHTEAIVSQNVQATQRFSREVDSAVIAVNASTRFTDGAEFGFGGEIGNSTQKLHCRGPMGLRELTTLKYLVVGDGHVRL